ncbi:IS30 family transposase [Actinophytocola xanthii]|nr:IS30 family transposase [Actinophytocola xanthii]
MGRPALPSEVARRFWSLMRTGVVLDDAAAVAGVSKAVAWRWFREAGGMIPAVASADSSSARSSRLSFSEREEISCRRAAGEGVRVIARALGRAPSTISRELVRGVRRRKTGYRATVAQAQADVRAKRPKRSKLTQNEELRAYVQEHLQSKHSPEQVSRRLMVDFPNSAEMRVSHEAIYRALYLPGDRALAREMTRCLRTGRALRKPRRRVAERRGRIANMVNISQRPAEVNERIVPGHWEGDLISGPQHRSAIGTLVERVTGYVVLLHLPHGRGADQVQRALVEAMTCLPEWLRRSLTWDQGRELTNHAQVAAATGMDIYFCDPHSPWQRGTNENTNGLLRQYFPRGNDLSAYHCDYLTFVANELNHRPRKRLAWKTPDEALHALLSTHQPGVALTA